MMRYLIVILSLAAITVHGQTNSEQARKLGMQAIEEMEAGKIQEAIQLLEEAKTLEPDNIDYPYEIAYAHYLNKDYSAAVKILKKLSKHQQANDRVFQMLGNSYDMAGKPEKAIAAYETGLKKYPASGALYLERGNMELIKENYTTALGYYEKGIAVQPAFPSNYYWAAKLYLNSNAEVWGLLYGELFMNLERNSARTAEISELLYNTYKSEITFSGDSTSTDFCDIIIDVEDIGEDGKMKLPFCMVYGQALIMATVDMDSVTLNSLDRLRTKFLVHYYELGYHKTHPNVLFAFQKELEAAGQLEAYNHWILMKGDEEDFGAWHNANEEKWKHFIDWFSKNPLQLSKGKHFHRTQY